MAAEVGWLDGEAQVRRVLRDAHRERHNRGREETKRRLAEIERLREAGRHDLADKLDERARRKSVQFMRGKRQREQIEAEIEWRKLDLLFGAKNGRTSSAKCPRLSSASSKLLIEPGKGRCAISIMIGSAGG